MKHLFICREFPPAAYLPGGIGTYVRNIAEGLACVGETVHVITQRWPGAPRLREERQAGRLVIHRVALDEPIPDPWAWLPDREGRTQRGLLAGAFPSQAFAWQAALLAERLTEFEDIDVVEAQEWEAPLYYLQQRRAAGLGPARQPPCVVHLHSPSDRIYATNGWATGVADYAPAVAMEAYSITHADALLAPSRFLAEETAARFGFSQDRIRVIPYPIGPGLTVARPVDTWRRNTICHVGRLEPRKGVLEWAEAVATVAAGRPDLRAEFVGGDTSLSCTGGASVHKAMLARIPPERRNHLIFHGNMDRVGLAAVLASASLGVVPSRWENFPNSCMELMSSGLPVVVSPDGGMKEMLEDGVSGWIAASSTPAGLAAALERALATPPEVRQRMGECAAETIRRVCDDGAVIRRHIEFKQALVTNRPHPGAWRDELPETPELAVEACPVLPVGSPFDPNLLTRHRALVFVAAGVMALPRLGLAMAGLFAHTPDLRLASAWLADGAGGDRIWLPDSPGAPQTWFDDLPFPLLAVDTALLGVERAASGLSLADLSELARLALQGGAAAAVFPGVLARYTPSPAAPPPGWQRRGGRSAMALAVQRPHLPLFQWLGLCPWELYPVLALNALRGIRARLAGSGAKVTPPLPPAPPTPLDRSGEPGLVSVIIAAYNAAPYIEETLASAQAQTWRNLEIIVVDDGSTDDTMGLVARLAARDERIRLLRQRNRGVAAARNRAMAVARGEYFAPLDADDLWAPTKLERQIQRLEDTGSETGLVYCGWIWLDAEGRYLDRSPTWQVEGRALEKLTEINFVGNASIPLFRRSCYERHGGYDSRLRDLAAQGCEDWDLLLRIAEHHPVASVPEILVGYRRLPTSMSSSCRAMWRSGCRTIAELAARQPTLPPAVLRRSHSQLALHLAGISFWSGRRWEACLWALRAKAPGLLLAIAPYVLRLLLDSGRSAITLPVAHGAADLSRTDCKRPWIPYDQIYARYWACRAEAANREF